MVQTRNPATGDLVSSFEPLSPAAIERALSQAQTSFQSWRRSEWNFRAAHFKKLAQVLRSEKENLSRLITLEMGKPITQSRAEVEKCASCCELYAGEGEEWFQDEILSERQPKAYVSYQPLGVVLGIMPWNFPLWQTVRFFVPTALARNTVLMKGAMNTWGVSEAFSRCVQEAGFPPGVYQDFPVEHSDIEKAIADHRVKAVSLTGSTRAGKVIGEQAARAIKPIVLELGGSDPYVVLHDANLKLAAEKAVEARMLNGGQSCIAGKRFIVDTKVHDEFLNLVYQNLHPYRMGQPMLDSCRLGPMARFDLRDQLEQQVQRALKQGAAIFRFEDQSHLAAGAYYPATVLSEVKEDSVVFQEEFFGPVAAVIRAKDEKDALRLANATSFGLGAAIFSRDEERAEALARTELEAGLCVVNGVVRSDPRWPFGGIKESGFGRELTRFGAREFVNTKTILVD